MDIKKYTVKGTVTNYEHPHSKRKFLKNFLKVKLYHNAYPFMNYDKTFAISKEI